MSASLPGARRIVALLSFLYALSFIDRLILSLLITPIKSALHISDTRIGILFGLSFALVYTLSGLPLARFADHGNRKRLVVAGVLVWGAATALSGLAWDYTSLLLCRGGVAIGEAVLTPTAISLIADLFPADARATPTSLYTASGTVTGLAAAAIGGAVLALATALSPSLHGIPPWRLTLLIVGALTVLAALAFATLVREPARRADGLAPETNAFNGHAARHWRFYVPFFLAIGFSTIVGYAVIGWVPTLLVRQFHMPPTHAGYLFGAIGITSGLAGTVSLPAMVRAANRRWPDGMLRLGAGASILALPAAVCAVLAPSLAVFTPALFVAFAAISGLTLMPALAVQIVTPARLRARMMAIYLLLASLLGLGLGPTLAGLLSDTLFHTSGGMGASLAALSVVALPMSAVLLLAARWEYLGLLRGVR